MTSPSTPSTYSPRRSPKIAILHDWFDTYAGSERQIEQFVNLFPDADLFSVADFLKPEDRWFIHNKPITTTFIQHLPFAQKHFRKYLALMPFAVEQLDLSGYDIILSDNHAVSKGVITNPDQLHISLCCSPMRYAWDLQTQYLKQAGLERGLKSWATRLMLHYLRLWDFQSHQRVDHLFAVSQFIARRIQKVYGREVPVLYPPVAVQDFELTETKDDFYLTASRMVPYKCIDKVVEAFASMPDKQLVVIGDGSERELIESKAAGCTNIKFLGHAPFSVLKAHLQQAKAFIFPPLEDFGIIPLEAQACGTPVIAYGRGGSLETVKGLAHEQPTGLHFYEQTPEAIASAVQQFELQQHRFTPQACRSHAESFSTEQFCRNIQAVVEQAWQAHCSRQPAPVIAAPALEPVEASGVYTTNMS